MLRPVTQSARWALLAVLLLLLPCISLWAQPAEPPPPQIPEEKPPRSIREAYERAENFGEEPGTEKGKPEARPPSPWFDGVHYAGVGGGLFLLAGLATGLWIYLVVAFRTGPYRVLIRRVWRRWHYALGFVAGGLALTYVVGRYVQAGDSNSQFGAPTVTAAVFLLLVISGIIRAWPPRPRARHHQWWTWSHRGLTALAVLALVWDGVTMYAEFVLHR